MFYGSKEKVGKFKDQLPRPAPHCKCLFSQSFCGFVDHVLTRSRAKSLVRTSDLALDHQRQLNLI
jgi:hypothetical protein